MLPPARETAASARLDAARGISALLVLVGHLRAMFLLDAKDLPNMSRPVQLLYGITGLGHEAVVVFFVLSGFFISASIIRPLQQGTWSGKKYTIDRVSRLYTVLVPTLIIGLAIDYAGTHFISSANVYAIPNYGQSVSLGPTSLSIQTLLGNLAFLQTTLVPTLGTNGPLWSLANEGWYYVAFPLLALAVVRSTRWFWRILFLIIGCAIALFMGHDRHLFLVWMFGPGLVLLPRPTIMDTRTAVVLSYVAVIASLALSRFHSIPDAPRDLIIGVCVAVWLWTQGYGAKLAKPTVGLRLSTGLAALSYTLYLVHFPFLALACAVVLGTSARMAPTPQSLGICVAVGLAALAWAGVQWFCFERNTGLVRRRVSAALGSAKT